MIGKQERIQKILIVSSHPAEAETWCNHLQTNYYQAKIESDQSTALKKVSRWRPDLIILDMNDSHDNILLLSRQIRQNCVCPILLLIYEYDEHQVLEYYSAGIQDCIFRPIFSAILLNRVRTWLNPNSLPLTADFHDLEAGGIRLLTNESRVLLPGCKTAVPLTNLEFRLLHLLMSRPGFVYESQRIVTLVWGISSKDDTNIVKHVIYRLRRKIETDPANPQYICSVPGRGYHFCADEGTDPGFSH